MSYRAQRLIWSRHPAALFSGALVLFRLVAVDVARRAKRRQLPVSQQIGHVDTSTHFSCTILEDGNALNVRNGLFLFKFR
jgi:hypothetical protein